MDFHQHLELWRLLNFPLNTRRSTCTLFVLVYITQSHQRPAKNSLSTKPSPSLQNQTFQKKQKSHSLKTNNSKKLSSPHLLFFYNSPHIWCVCFEKNISRDFSQTPQSSVDRPLLLAFPIGSIQWSSSCQEQLSHAEVIHLTFFRGDEPTKRGNWLGGFNPPILTNII